jgi:hypothetical protein
MKGTGNTTALNSNCRVNSTANDKKNKRIYSISLQPFQLNEPKEQNGQTKHEGFPNENLEPSSFHTHSSINLIHTYASIQ